MAMGGWGAELLETASRPIYLGDAAGRLLRANRRGWSGSAMGATYTVLHVSGSGPITSSDPRFVGTIVADALILDNPITGMGVSTDDFRVLDPVTGEVKMQGTAWALDQAPSPIKGLATGELADGSRFVTLSTVTLPAGPTDPLTIEYGGPGFPAADRAIVVQGECGKIFKHFGFR